MSSTSSPTIYPTYPVSHTAGFVTLNYRFAPLGTNISCSMVPDEAIVVPTGTCFPFQPEYVPIGIEDDHIPFTASGIYAMALANTLDGGS
jgi:hypothetical protein